MRHPLLTGHEDLDSIDGLPLLGPTSIAEEEDSNDPSATITSSDISVTLHDFNDKQDSNEDHEKATVPEKLNAKSLGIRKRTPANSRNPSEAEPHELHTLLPTAGYASGVSSREEHAHVSESRASSSTAAPSYPPILGAHKPIPASVIFARTAAPLSLSHLDDYLATVPAPSFPALPRKGGSNGVQMFPPMDRLAAIGRSLEDLETNTEVAPWWRNRNSIFGTLTGWVLGITVCSPKTFPAI